MTFLHCAHLVIPLRLERRERVNDSIDVNALIDALIERALPAT